MKALGLHEFHQRHGAHFRELSGVEVVQDYGDARSEYDGLRSSAGVMDLSGRGRLCLVGQDRARFLHGQVTQNVKDLKSGTGSYALLTTNKGKIQADLNLHALPDELLLDFEPGLTTKVAERLEKYIVADDVQVVDVAPHYGLLTVQGPKAASVVEWLGLFPAVPDGEYQSAQVADASLGELYLVRVPRLGTAGFDLFVPVAAMEMVADRLSDAAKRLGGGLCGWQAFETARIEAGIPRYGADLDESNLPQEAGLEHCAVSFVKGCYIGQEVINRIRSLGQVTRALRGLRLAAGHGAAPTPGDKLWHQGQMVGHLTSVVHSPGLDADIALGYVRRECNEVGTRLEVKSTQGESSATIVPLPFV